MRVLVVPGEAAELEPLETWVESGRNSGELTSFRAVSHTRAPYALRSARWDVVVCDLAAGIDEARNLLREARSGGLGVPFVLIGPHPSNAAPSEIGNTPVLSREELSAESVARAVAEATRHLKPSRPRPAPSPEAKPEPAVEVAPRRESDPVPAMLFRTDRQGEFTRMTREWKQFTGHDGARERPGGKGSGWLDVLHPADQLRFAQAFDSARDADEPFELDLRIQRRESEYRWLRVRGFPRSDGFVGSAFDVTDLVQRVADMRRLEDDNRDLRQFTYAVAHDLQVPLRALGSWLRQAVDVAPGESIEPIGRALDTLEQTQHMVRDLLECAAVETSGEALARTELREPLDWALSNLGDLVRTTGARVEVGPLVAAHCDAPQIARVFQNLIANALKFAGTEPPHIRIAAAIDRDQVRVRVRDNGIGIDPRWQATIFELFQRAPGSDTEGSGVGLALCKRIVERHGGQIQVASEPGSGACFEFTLPAG